MDAFLVGLVAGYGIAIPVGAIAILIAEVGLTHGFRSAFVAGAGAATADFLYAGLAVVGGRALAGAVALIDAPIRITSALVLIVISLVGLTRVGRPSQIQERDAYSPRNHLAWTYVRFVSLTFINPTTIVYFAAVIIGLGVANNMTGPQGALFVGGAFMASLSWQTVIASIGSLARNRLPTRLRKVAIVVGNMMILALAIVILTK